MSADSTHSQSSGEQVDSTPIEAILSPFQRFFQSSSSGGILLILCTIAALVWANSPWSDSYGEFFNTIVTIGAGAGEISKPLVLWINDGLMAIFFFVVGLEIKREVQVGELSNVRSAALPVAAAIGGIIVPGLIYFALNSDGPGASGWAIPAATDIAFALGVLALLGSRAPTSLKVFLTAVAIVDDIAAVLIIALFYTGSLSTTALLFAAAFLILLMATNRLGVRNIAVYGLLGFGLWVAFLKSGVHATVAGVLAAMTIPARTRINSGQFVNRVRSMLAEFERDRSYGAGGKADHLMTQRQRGAVGSIEDACEKIESPAHRLEYGLHPWVVFAIMPIFALANAGIELGSGFIAAFTEPVTLGVLLGLVIGKQVGVSGAAWIAHRLNLAAKPSDVSWAQIYGAAWLAGIGFTMSLFITALAFESPELQNQAKAGILAASLIAGGVGYWLIRKQEQSSGS